MLTTPKILTATEITESGIEVLYVPNIPVVRLRRKIIRTDPMPAARVLHALQFIGDGSEDGANSFSTDEVARIISTVAEAADTDEVLLFNICQSGGSIVSIASDLSDQFAVSVGGLFNDTVHVQRRNGTTANVSWKS